MALSELSPRQFLRKIEEALRPLSSRTPHPQRIKALEPATGRWFWIVDVQDMTLRDIDGVDRMVYLMLQPTETLP